MPRIIMLIPIGSGVGLTTISLGLVRALEREGVRINFFKPVAQLQLGDKGPERSSEIIRRASRLAPPEPFQVNHVENLISSGQRDVFLEEVVARLHQGCGNEDVVVVEGMVPTRREDSGINTPSRRVVPLSMYSTNDSGVAPRSCWAAMYCST